MKCKHHTLNLTMWIARKKGENRQWVFIYCVLGFAFSILYMLWHLIFITTLQICANTFILWMWSSKLSVTFKVKHRRLQMCPNSCLFDVKTSALLIISFCLSIKHSFVQSIWFVKYFQYSISCMHYNNSLNVQNQYYLDPYFINGENCNS